MGCIDEDGLSKFKNQKPDFLEKSLVTFLLLLIANG